MIYRMWEDTLSMKPSSLISAELYERWLDLVFQDGPSDVKVVARTIVRSINSETGLADLMPDSITISTGLGLKIVLESLDILRQNGFLKNPGLGQWKITFPEALIDDFNDSLDSQGLTQAIVALDVSVARDVVSTLETNGIAYWDADMNELSFRRVEAT